MKIVIVGGGSAGTTCAYEIRKLNKDVEITILEKSNYTEYSPCALPYVLSGEIKSLEDITILGEDDYTKNNITLLLDSEVIDIDKKKRKITYKNDEKRKNLNYDKLVIATGSSAFLPPIPGMGDAEYHTLKTMDDAKYISENIKENTSSVIIGGGLIGVELALSLVRKKEKVTLIEAKENIFSSILDSDIADRLKEYLKSEDIKIYEDQTIKKIASRTIFLNDKNILFDKLFFCTGIRANTSLAKKLGLDVDRAILVNDKLQTSERNIFACGDCVKSVERNSGKKILSQLGTSAVRQAKIIANNIISKKKKRFPSVMNNTITKIGDIFVGSVGLSVLKCKQFGLGVIFAKYTGNVCSEYYPSESKITIKLVCLADGKIVGGQIIGDEGVVGRIDIIALAIQKKMNVQDLAELETCYNPASAPIFDPLCVAAEICMKKVAFLNGE